MQIANFIGEKLINSLSMKDFVDNTIKEFDKTQSFSTSVDQQILDYIKNLKFPQYLDEVKQILSNQFDRDLFLRSVFFPDIIDPNSDQSGEPSETYSGENSDIENVSDNQNDTPKNSNEIDILNSRNNNNNSINNNSNNKNENDYSIENEQLILSNHDISDSLLNDEKMNESFPKLQKDINNIVTTLNIHPDVAFFLLRACKWSIDLVFSEFSDNSEKLLEKAHILPDTLHQSHSLQKLSSINSINSNSDMFECPICYEVYPKDEVLCLPCNHLFCINCWKESIERQIDNGIDPSCLQFSCNSYISFQDVLNLLGQNYASKMIKYDSSFSFSLSLRPCPRPGCNNFISADSVGLCSTAKCSCGMRICWRCGEEAHAPLSCSNLLKWRELQQKENTQAKWLLDNTKPCPNCQSRIEKNGGCNHMTCKKCGHEFCWICGKNWKGHRGNAYKCNIPVDLNKTDSNGEIINMDRLFHYSTRYANHQQSAVSEKLQRNEVKKKISLYCMEFNDASQSLPPKEALNLAENIFDTIDLARSVLIFSYPHAYFLKPESSEIKLFEHAQGEVEKEFEIVTDMVENNIMKSPLELAQAVKLLNNYINVLLKQVDALYH